MSRGLWLAGLLVLGASLAAVPSVAGTSSSCGLVVNQDDAGSQRDAGANPSQAVQLPYEDEFPASISYPKGPAVDAEDWFRLSWDSEEEHDVMVNVSTRALGLTYMTDERLPAPHMGLEAYEPGADEPTHVGTMSKTGVVSLDFTTERSDWDIRVFLPSENDDEICPTTQSLDASFDQQSYNLYWGCQPHCVVTTT